MSYVRLWVHAVWGTKNREHILTKTVLPLLLDHIRQNAAQKHIHIDTLNGSSDHLHCLLGLNAEMTIARTIQLIKGESAHWMNHEGVIPRRFEWAAEYYAASVNESGLDAVRRYIRNQEEHHRKKSYAEEVGIFLQEYHFPLHG